MRSSEVIHLVTLLDMYIGPTPTVTELVQRQLLHPGEAERIRTAVERRAKGDGATGTLYSTWLSHSGLDFNTKPTNLVKIVNSGDLHWAMFDLMLGQSVKSFHLNHYSEVHEVRGMMERFLHEYNPPMALEPDTEKLWWDEIDPNQIAHSPWIPKTLRADSDFVPLLESWLNDSRNLQHWLDDRESWEDNLHNPMGQYPVVSPSTATRIMVIAKV